MDEDEEGQTHPSYGQVLFSRISGGSRRLYGSPVRKHGDSIILEIRRSEVTHRLGSTYFFGRKRLIEVELSAAQFASLLTTMNVGSGIPCTIRQIDGERVEDPPDDDPLEHERVAHAFTNEGKYATRINGALAEAEAALRETLERKAIRKADVREALAKVVSASQDVKANLPFMLGQFREAAERVATTVKAEADAWLTNTVVRAGLTSLRGDAPSIETLDLKQIEED